jgi:hypothetical protein
MIARSGRSALSMSWIAKKQGIVKIHILFVDVVNVLY